MKCLQIHIFCVKRKAKYDFPKDVERSVALYHLVREEGAGGFLFLCFVACVLSVMFCLLVHLMSLLGCIL